MDLRTISATNAQRCAEWHDMNEWSVSDWAVAMAGEAGEVCNAVKKLNRIRDGIRASNNSGGEAEQLDEIGKEIADTFLYLDLLAHRIGRDLQSLVIAKFNEVTRREGLSTLLPEDDPAAVLAIPLTALCCPACGDDQGCIAWEDGAPEGFCSECDYQWNLDLVEADPAHRNVST